MVSFRVTALFFIFSSTAFADITVKSLRLDKNRIVIEATSGEQLSNGQTLQVTSDMDESCDIIVTKVQGKFAAADVSKCSFAKELRVGQSLSRGGGGGSSSHAGGWRHQIGPQIYYSMVRSIESTGKVGSTSITATDATAGALGLGVDYKLSITQDFGVRTGFAYEMARAISERKYSNGATSTFNPKPTLSFMWLEINGFYSMWGFSAYGGINYNIPSITDAPDLSVSGALGLQIGVQYNFTDMFAADLAYRTINFSASETGIAYDSSRLWGILLRGSVYFDFL